MLFRERTTMKKNDKSSTFVEGYETMNKTDMYKRYYPDLPTNCTISNNSSIDEYTSRYTVEIGDF